MKPRSILEAAEGKVLTNGTTFGKLIFLAEGADPAEYREITEEEYERHLAEQAERPPI